MALEITDSQFREFVPRYYQLNPETDHLLFDGNELVDGMIVLLEDPGHRGVDEPMGEATASARQMCNRWTQVSRLVNDGETVRFIGIYADGSQRKWVRPIEDAWLCKKGVH